MATIVIHAGRPKAGSTSVQLWLGANSSVLRKHGFTVVVAPRNEAEEVVFVPYEKGPVVSGWTVVRATRKPAERQPEIADVFAEALATAADRYGNVVVSSEGFAGMFGALPALESLQRLSVRHEVRVAYYARPQHTSLEAMWRQAGYRSGMSPSAHVVRNGSALRYAETRRRVRSVAPGLNFDPVPFRRDLLESGDVVADFARRFLGVEAGKTVWANRGLPLEAVNLLRAASDGTSFDVTRNGRGARLKRLLADNPLPEDERIALSRRVLQKYAHERFAAENAELGWEDFVPPPEDAEELPGIEALDELWTPQASPAELRLLVRALDAAIR